ncbi:uncharacterized protein LOC131215671 [Anopheles bellator]|uniref:uncharacterized protein LOC131215671 n=1 Tax=Anopheles bellator TaxID=139047 RepID=UPI0026488970|nr:uncharacterized protein LOC131215671 [Anopheles bellator]
MKSFVVLCTLLAAAVAAPVAQFGFGYPGLGGGKAFRKALRRGFFPIAVAVPVAVAPIGIAPVGVVAPVGYAVPGNGFGHSKTHRKRGILVQNLTIIIIITIVTDHILNGTMDQ